MPPTDSTSEKKRPRIVIFASPKCIEEPKLYKAYFNVAWFVRAYRDVLEEYEILTTQETQIADQGALEGVLKYGNAERDPHNSDKYWDVPLETSLLSNAETGRYGFDGQIRLMGEIVRGEVEQVLMFMDPLDTKEYLPETYAFIRNCTLAGVGLHINLGATYWAESERKKKNKHQGILETPIGFGPWRASKSQIESGVDFNSLLNPPEQMVHFIAHDSEKEKMSRFVYHYRKILANRALSGWKFSGTFGTCAHIEKYLDEQLTPYWERPPLKPAGTGKTGHGPTGGDVVIADEVSREWPVEDKPVQAQKKNELPQKETLTVRQKSVSHTVLFFIDYYHARPHETDIHVLLRTCLNPHRGVHLILNERSAIEWGETMRDGCFSGKEDTSTNLQKERTTS